MRSSMVDGLHSGGTGQWVTAFGAVGDGLTDCTAAIEAAMQAAAAAAAVASSRVVVVPAGTYLTHPINLPSHVTLQVDVCAVVSNR